MELLSDTSAHVQREPLRIGWKTDSRHQNRAKLVKTRVERERKAKHNVCVDAEWPRSWACKVTGASSGCERVSVEVCLPGFPLAVLCTNQARRKSLFMCRQRICSGLNIHPVSHVVHTHTRVRGGLLDILMITWALNITSDFWGFFQSSRKKRKSSVTRPDRQECSSIYYCINRHNGPDRRVIFTSFETNAISR